MKTKMTRGDRNIAWIEKYCRIPEGKDVGKAVRLRDWQKRVIKGIYDTPTRTAIISFGRKNAKTALSAFLLLLNICGPEARPNSQLYSAAQSRDQAAILFKLAAKCVRLSHELSAYVKVTESKKELTCPDLGTFYKALSSDVATSYGFSPVFLVHDELGQVKGPTSELYDALETACGAHEEPLSIIISTQAATDNDLLSILIDDAQSGADPTIKCFLYTAPENLDPFALETLRYANPALGDFLSESEVLKTAEKARRMVSMMPAYRNLHLNQRVERNTPFVSRDVWDSGKREVDDALLFSGEVSLGLDLSARTDLTAMALSARDLITGEVHCHMRFYAPEMGLLERSKRDKVPYLEWADMGLLTLCPGATIDYDFIAEELETVLNKYNITSLNYDRWRMDVLKSSLVRRSIDVESLPLKPFGQGFKDMSPAIDELEALLLNSQLIHGGNPILRWNIANCMVVEDTAGNRKLNKSRKTARIDGAIALIMSVAGLAGEGSSDIFDYSGLTSV